MAEISRAGAVNIEYNHFPVGELWEPGFERIESKPDFDSDDPVLVTPGQIIVRVKSQAGIASVVLAVGSHLDQAPGPAWTAVATVDYQPIYTGRMAAFDTTNGPAGPAAESVHVFGQQAGPGEPAIILDPSHTYRVRVWTRAPAQLEGEPGGDFFRGTEAYVLVFVAAGVQAPPTPAAVESRRDRLARAHGRPPLNMR